MDMPRFMKYILYGFVFFCLAFGFYKKIEWFGILILFFVLYGAYRFMVFQCMHKWTGIPMILTLLVIGAFGLINITSLSILALTMLFDIFV